MPTRCCRRNFNRLRFRLRSSGPLGLGLANPKMTFVGSVSITTLVSHEQLTSVRDWSVTEPIQGF